MLRPLHFLRMLHVLTENHIWLCMLNTWYSLRYLLFLHSLYIVLQVHCNTFGLHLINFFFLVFQFVADVTKLLAEIEGQI